MRAQVASPTLGPALVTATVSLALLLQAAATPVLAYAVGATVGATVTALSAAGMLILDCFGARLVALSASSVSGVLALVTMLLGPPGDRGAEPTTAAAVLVLCALALPLQLRRRGEGCTGADRTYPQAP